MRKVSFSNRVALYFMGATAVLTVVIFLTIYGVVYRTVYTHLDDDLNAESLELFNSIVILSDQIIFANPNEWLENEHGGQIEVNPTFIQFADTNGNVIKKSANLENESLHIMKNKTGKIYFDDVISGSRIYQLQMPVNNHLGKPLGYLSVAMPLDETIMVLRNLRIVLIITFPIVLFVLYFITDLIARKSIAPVYRLTNAAQHITHKNFSERIKLPSRRDELYTLTKTINDLIDRLQGTLMREKQFTSDASHELRTPLSILRGSFEVMLRKKRSAEYYEDKIQSGLKEINRMSELVEQLLLLARYEGEKENITKENVGLEELVHELAVRLHDQAEEKLLSFDIQISRETFVNTDRFMLGQILENLLTNAIKYSSENGTIHIHSASENNGTMMVIRDNGAGMSTDELDRVFEKFYRSDISRNSVIKGSGLGLSIVKRFTDLLGIGIQLSSEPGKGTEFILNFS